MSGWSVKIKELDHGAITVHEKKYDIQADLHLQIPGIFSH